MPEDIIISLAVKGHEYKFLAKTLTRHKDTLHKLDINELLKEDLIKDINITLSILSKSELKPQPIIQEESKIKKEAQDANKH